MILGHFLICTSIAELWLSLLQDKIDSLWSITKIEVKDLKAQLHGKDREAEEIERRHQIEIKVVSYSKLNL